MGRRSDLMLYSKALAEGWPIELETKQRIIKLMLDIAEGHVKSSTREKIRAVECLAKIDALNVSREGQEKSKRVDIQVLPPAYEQLSEQANTEMVAYLQSASAELEPQD